MTNMLSLAWFSLKSRKSTALLTLFSLSLAVILLLGVERIRTQIKDSFTNTLSKTDLIVGGRTGQINLLLYTIFRIGHATNNINWKTITLLEEHPSVSWVIPISLGDSHQGFRVLGTDQRYFQYYKYGKSQPLTFSEGKEFQALHDVVIGAEVARKLSYQLGTPLIIAHGLIDAPFNRHNNLPFQVVGILAPTGTPVDKTIHVSLSALEAIHSGLNGQQEASHKTQPLLLPQQVTAALIGVNSKFQLFSLQRYLNTYPLEPLSAIIPAMALQELWQILSIAEQAFILISLFVIFTSLLGMFSVLLISQKERQREIAILRVIGARPYQLFFLLILESTLLTFISLIIGVIGLNVVSQVASPIITQHYGIFLPKTLITEAEIFLLLGIQGIGSLIGILHAVLSYKQSLHYGVSIRA